MTQEFEREKLSSSLRWLIYGLWVVAVVVISVLVIIYVFPLTIFPNSRTRIVFMIAVAVVLNTVNTKLFYSRKPLSDRGLRVLLTINILIIQIFITVVVSITGGIESVAPHIFHFVTFFTILVFSARAVVLFGSLSVFFLSVMYALEYQGIITHFDRYQHATLGIFGYLEPTILNAIATSIWILAVAVFGSFVGHIIKNREQQILLERHRVSVIINDLPDGILLLDPRGQLIYMNPSAEIITGVDSEQALNRIFNPKKRDAGFEKLHDLLFTLPQQKKEQDLPINSLPSFEYMMGDKDRERYFEVTPLPVTEVNGAPLGKMVIIHDITREKLVNKLKSEFISVAAHQLRTPLTAVKWALQMVRDGEIGSLNDEQYEMLEKGFVSNQRMINLVNDLLDASRIEEGRFRYELKKISIEEMIQDLLPEFDHVIQEQKLQLSVNIPPTKLPYVYGDESKLRMVFQNLIDNAIRYTRPAGKIGIRINYSPEIGMIAFGLQDTGVGIPVEAQPHIFSKFFRAENVVRLQTEGSGLGLFIARNIVEKHGGTLSFRSEEGKGTEFTVTLPVYHEWQEIQKTSGV